MRNKAEKRKSRQVQNYLDINRPAPLLQHSGPCLTPGSPPSATSSQATTPKTDRYKLELYRLHAKVRHLESDIKDKDGRLLKALAALDDELMFWRTGLNCHVWETYDEMSKRMNRIVGAIDYLKDVQPHVSPPLPIPARWKTK